MAKTKEQAHQQDVKLRAAKNRAVRAEVLREQIQGTQVLNRIAAIDKEYEQVITNIKTMKRGVSEDKARQIKLRLEALGKSADLNFKKLRKLLPDMQHVEMETPAGDTIFDAFSKAVAEGIDKFRALPNNTPVPGEKPPAKAPSDISH